MSVRKGLPCLMHVYSLLRNYTSSLGTELPVHPSRTLLFTASLACLSRSLVRIAHVTGPLARSPHPGADRPSCSACLIEASGSIVLISSQRAPFFIPLSAPLSPMTTLSSTSWSGREVITTSTDLPSSMGEGCAVAPFCN